MSRPPTRRPDDATGFRILDAGVGLLRAGVPLEDLRLTDAVATASKDGKGKITIGAAYPRFPGGQSEFRLAVLARALELDHAHHRDAALTVLAQKLRPLDVPLPAAEVPALIEAVAGVQEKALRHDASLPLRLYATYRITEAGQEGTQNIRQELARRDEQLSSAWSNAIEAICSDLNIKPRPGFEYRDFEIFVTSLLSGLALRSRTSTVPQGLYAKLVLAAAFGFFEGVDATPSQGVGPALARWLRRLTRRRLDKARILDAAKDLISAS